MSIFLDRKYLLQVSHKLSKFTKKNDNLFNFRCPFCGDSQKDKKKTRGYVYHKKNSYFYMCHNCGLSISFYNFLDRLDGNLAKQYSLEKFTNGDTKGSNTPQPDVDDVKSKPVFYDKLDLETISSLPEEHFAKKYVVGRQIPESFWPQLYFAPDFKKFVETLGVDKDGLKEDDQRLIIPFFNKEKKLTYIQGRALGESKVRYITIKIDKEAPKLYGLDRIDENKMIYVTEGPIDSMFLENAVATADANLSSVSNTFERSKVTLIFDNEPRNKNIVKLIENAIDEHYNVVVWPEMIESKDINEMLLEGLTQEDIQDLIEKNTFVNLRAKMEFMRWKKI